MLRRGLIIGAASAVFGAAAWSAEPDPLVGVWSGTLQSEAEAHRLRIELRPDGAAELIDLDADGLPVKGRITSRTSAGGSVEFTVKNPVNPHVNFQATNKGGQLEGTWTQGQYNLPLALTPGDPPGWSEWSIYTTELAPLNRSRLETYRRTFQTPALAAAVWRDGQNSLWCTGRRRVDADVPVTELDQWRIGSISKSMTATLVARLVEAGLIGWDDAVGEVLGGAVGAMRPEYRGATYRHLLTHRAGLIEDLPGDVLARFSFDKVGPAERLEYVRQALAAGPVAVPGEKFSYSSAGYVVAAAMMEVTVGQRWEELMWQHVFGPLSLGSAGFGSPGTAGKIEQPFGHKLGLHGYEVVQAGSGLRDIPAVVGPAGGIHINLADLLTYLAAHARRRVRVNGLRA